jgi:hypothetical protein
MPPDAGTIAMTRSGTASLTPPAPPLIALAGAGVVPLIGGQPMFTCQRCTPEPSATATAHPGGATATPIHDVVAVTSPSTTDHDAHDRAAARPQHVADSACPRGYNHTSQPDDDRHHADPHPGPAHASRDSRRDPCGISAGNGHTGGDRDRRDARAPGGQPDPAACAARAGDDGSALDGVQL